MKQSSNITGFSLIELLVALGLSSMLSIGILTITQESVKSSADIKIRYETLQALREIVQAVKSTNPVNPITYSNKCSEMFVGMDIGSTSTAQAVGKWIPGVDYRYGQIVFDDLQIPAKTSSNVDNWSSPQNNQQGHIEVEASFHRFQNPNEIYRRRFMIWATVDLAISPLTNHSITDCSLAGTTTGATLVGGGTEYWEEQVLGNPNDIYQDLGKVGVGDFTPLDPPQANLHIRGKFRPMATASLNGPCTNGGILAIDPATNSPKICNGSSWQAAGSGLKQRCNGSTFVKNVYKGEPYQYNWRLFQALKECRDTTGGQFIVSGVGVTVQYENIYPVVESIVATAGNILEVTFRCCGISYDNFP